MRIHRAAVAAMLLPLLAACGSNTTATPKAGGSHTAATPRPAATTVTTHAGPVTAETVTTALAHAVPGLKLIEAYTAANDPNHLLGRPSGYSSKTAFSDPRVKPSDVTGEEHDAINRGGSVEVYPTAGGAKDRAAYIQRIIKAMPSATEYDYVHGRVLIRVSALLTPQQAAAYRTVVDGL